MNASYELWQDGIRVAQTDGPKEQALAQILHYAMMYSQDGPIIVYEKIGGNRRTIDPYSSRP